MNKIQTEMEYEDFILDYLHKSNKFIVRNKIQPIMMEFVGSFARWTAYSISKKSNT